MCFKWHRERVTNTKDREEQSNGASASGERSSYHSWSRSKCHSVATAHLSSCGGGTTEAGVACCCTWTLPSTLERSVWVRTTAIATPEKKNKTTSKYTRVLTKREGYAKEQDPFNKAVHGQTQMPESRFNVQAVQPAKLQHVLHHDTRAITL